ncbi:hypothetical protein [Caballeronia sp. DA-9]|uniref:hypothetical protein n=1 Tax=Caballeronia sp. DA-9 TaxID=3436237 RepID=UPI003F67C346
MIFDTHFKFSGFPASHVRASGAILAASILLLSACAPVPPADNAAVAVPSAASAPVVTSVPKPQARSRSAEAIAAGVSGPPGVQRIDIGGPSGYRTEVSITPPKQVCDLDAFADGVQYGYAYTWNRLVMEQIRDAGKPSTPPKAQFDPAGIHLQDEQYKIVWNGEQRVNACASDGYLIGRIVGTHQALVDMKGGAS